MATSPAAAHGTATIVTPSGLEYNSRLQQHAARACEKDRPPNSVKVYDPKTEEWDQFCEQIFPHERHAKILDPLRVYRFIYYQTFREQRKRGGKTKTSSFNLEDYNAVMARCDSSDSNTACIDGPQKGIGKQAMAQYKAVLHRLYDQQVVLRCQRGSDAWSAPAAECNSGRVGSTAA